ncbi:geranyl transferase [Halovibrio salipaludis]|uniref:Geranyl transferase n=1 Tax=Halovibrio salipaludis TaxID=2032626 RepID=A0A2A2F5P4_9GAMM|nr:farnesyl diphosphate synthase [Halovibrio salipaludis]PAU79925.1 geranyl transferase [Halovibrio salipaludis]
MTVDAFLSDTRQRLELALEQALPDPDTEPRRLHQAMRHAVLGGGKRLRPALVLAACRCAGESSNDGALPAAVAVELIHAYSLVHDDLPAMDDDHLRRGQPTCHVAFDEATAILTGDALQTLAFETLSGTDRPAATVVAMIRELSAASGHRGMAGGQALDLDATGAHPSMDALEALHRRKTGALIEASLVLGAHCGAGDEALIASLRAFGRSIGLAFQVQDDILDVEGSASVTGKPQGSDTASDKATYTALLGMEGARERLDALHRDALGHLERIPGDTSLLAALAAFIIERNH